MGLGGSCLRGGRLVVGQSGLRERRIDNAKAAWILADDSRCVLYCNV